MFESLNDMPDLRAAFAELDKNWRATIERVVRSAARAKQIGRGVDAAAFATLLLASLRGILMQWLIAPDQVELARSYAELDRWLESALR